MTITMFDIGEVNEVYLTKAVEDEDRLEFVICGENGEVYACYESVSLYSRRVVIPVKLPSGLDVNIFDVRLLALYLMIEHRSIFPMIDSALNSGAGVLQLKDKEESWRIVKRFLMYENGGCALDSGYGQEVWVNYEGRGVNQDGSRVIGPPWYFPELFTALAFGIRNNPIESDDLLEGLPDLTRMMQLAKSYKGVNYVREYGIDGHQFIKLYEFYELLRGAARSINMHVDNGDLSPKQLKFKELEDFYDQNSFDLASSEQTSDYAKYLMYCHKQIYGVLSSDILSRVPHVRRYSPIKFPLTKIWWDDSILH